MPNHTVLVVDDDETVRDATAAFLNRAGYRALSAACACDALVMLEAGLQVDLVLSDLVMPVKDGIWLLDEIVRSYPEVPVVIVTAIANAHSTLCAFRRGATDFLMKPFEGAELLDVVELAIRKGRARSSVGGRDSIEQKVSARTECLHKMLEALELSYDITLQAMGDALDLRDTETEGHSRRVTAYASLLACAMQLEPEDLRIVARGAFLHDIGKIATPDRILLKPDKLDEDEWRVMKDHCRRGYEIVSKIPFLRDASEIVYAHQEHFDGGGYPRGLSGDEIPLGARVFAVADALDAITSDRPYRGRKSFADAREEIRRCAGTQFDPHVVDAFLEIDSSRWEFLRTEVDSLAGTRQLMAMPALALLAA